MEQKEHLQLGRRERPEQKERLQLGRRERPEQKVHLGQKEP